MTSHGIVKRFTGEGSEHRAGDQEWPFPNRSCSLLGRRMEEREETSVITESDKPVCWNLVPHCAAPTCWFQNKHSHQLLCPLTGTGREDRRHGTRRVSAWPQ